MFERFTSRVHGTARRLAAQVKHLRESRTYPELLRVFAAIIGFAASSLYVIAAVINHFATAQHLLTVAGLA
jgi:hypothetical protein